MVGLDARLAALATMSSAALRDEWRAVTSALVPRLAQAFDDPFALAGSAPSSA